ncbi:MAG: ParA family protein [Sulfolobales archaeon]|nr:ParA family protein [Sulfolobales archaeon]
MPPKVITITNQKGGTGKTTLTALLGYALAEKGHRVLLIDLDPQTHLSSFFIKTDQLEDTSDGSFELIEGYRWRIRPVLRALKSGGKLDLIPSGVNYMIKSYRGQLSSARTFALRTKISTEVAINQNYDYVLCDTPPELYPPTTWGLYAADYLLIPMNTEELSFAGVKLFLKHIFPDLVRELRTAEKDIKLLGIVYVNVLRPKRRTGRGSLGRLKIIEEMSRKLERFIRDELDYILRQYIYNPPVFNTIIHRDSTLRDLPYRPRRRAIPLQRILSKKPMDEVFRLAEEVVERINNFRGLS